MPPFPEDEDMVQRFHLSRARVRSISRTCFLLLMCSPCRLWVVNWMACFTLRLAFSILISFALRRHASERPYFFWRRKYVIHVFPVPFARSPISWAAIATARKRFHATKMSTLYRDLRRGLTLLPKTVMSDHAPKSPASTVARPPHSLRHSGEYVTAPRYCNDQLF